MEIFGYSGPRFDLYREDAESEPLVLDDGPWPAPAASEPLEASLQIPGSKSITNRELVLAALADGPSTLHRPLHARDTELMITALEQLGATVEHVDGEGRFGDDLRVTPAEELTGGVSVDCGLAGTVMRFVPPVAALALGPVAFDGDEGARRRPMRTTVDALRALGVEVRDEGRGKLPFSLYGTGEVEGGEVEIDASASSQFVSGLLLAAPRFERGVTITHTGETLPSVPHIEMTLAALRGHGVDARRTDERTWRVEPGAIEARDVAIEPDLSNAEPFLIAAIVAGGAVEIERWPEETTQVGAHLIDILPRFGAEIARTEAGTLRISVERGIAEGARLPGVELDLSEGGELAPNLAALCALLDSPSRITGIAHLRGHETDRIRALATELRKIGCEVEELADGLAISPGELRPAEWSAYADHRMATSGAIVGLAIEGVTVDDIGSTSKTMPQFPELWARMLRPRAAEPTADGEAAGDVDLSSFGL